MTEPLDGVQLEWHGCYDGSWKGTITDASFAHPAKMARGLLDRILDHGLAQGYWQAGDLLADPFGGIGTTGILASYKGLWSVSVELEPRFVEMAKANFGLHAAKLKALGSPQPVMVLGDSRRFASLVSEAGAIVTSPPWDRSMNHPPGDNPTTRQIGRSQRFADYGTAPGQIGRLPAGDVQAVITSPPYAESVKGDHAEQETAAESRAKRRTEGGSLGQSQRHGGYGVAEGNIGNLKEGDAQAVRGIVTSPPYAEGGGHKPTERTKALIAAKANPTPANDYGTAPGQIGQDSSETYWHAMAEVYRQCHLVLKPGGVLAVVIKRYVKKGKIVPLPDQTWDLLLSIGFEPLERVRAMLVKETREAGLFGEVVERTERKSFFRRLAEGKGAPPIDWEDVLWVRKPASG